MLVSLFHFNQVSCILMKANVEKQKYKNTLIWNVWALSVFMTEKSLNLVFLKGNLHLVFFRNTLQYLV